MNGWLAIAIALLALWGLWALANFALDCIARGLNDQAESEGSAKPKSGARASV